MAPELRELLRDSAGRPDGPADLDDIARRARRIRRGRRARMALASLAVVALAVPAVNVVRDLFPDTAIKVAQEPTPGEGSAAPTGPRLTSMAGAHDLRVQGDIAMAIVQTQVATSTDGGVTWRLGDAGGRVLALDTTTGGRAIALIDERDPDVEPAVPISGAPLDITVASTDDAGATWFPVSGTLPPGEVDLAEIGPSFAVATDITLVSDGLTYLSIAGPASGAGDLDAGTTTLDTWSSDDSGATWTFAGSLPGAESADFAPGGLGIAAGRFSQHGIGFAMWRTDNEAASWVALGIDGTIGAVAAFSGPVVTDDGRAAVAIQDTDGRVSLLLTEADLDVEFREVGAGAQSGIQDLQLAPAGPDYADWLVGYPTSQDTSVVVGPGGERQVSLLLGLAGDGATATSIHLERPGPSVVSTTSDLGATWETVAEFTEPDARPIEPVPGPTDPVFAGATLDGLRWVLDDDGLRDLDGGPLALPDFIDPTLVTSIAFLDRDTAWLIEEEADQPEVAMMHVKNRAGANWERASIDVPTGSATPSWSGARILPVTADVVYLALPEGVGETGDLGSTLALSRDGGRTWSGQGRAPGSRFVTPSAEDILYSGQDGGHDADDTFWVSRDRGATWTQVPLEPVGDEVEVTLLGVAFHEASADLQAVHTYPDGRVEIATYIFGSPMWTLGGAVPLPDSLSYTASVDDWRSVSIGSEWWLLETSVEVWTVTRSFIGLAWREDFRPVGSYFDGDRDRVAAYRRDTCSDCDRTYTSADGLTWVSTDD